MKNPRNYLYVVLILIVFFSIGQSQERADVSGQIRAEATFQQLRGEFPDLQAYRQNGRIEMLYGQAFGSGQTPEEAANRFRLDYSEVFGAEAEDLRPFSLKKNRNNTLPLMYNPETDSYKFTLACYSQYRDDIPVFGSELRILVRNESDYPVVMATSSLRFLGDFRAVNRNNVQFEPAREAAGAAIPSLTDFSEGETVIWAGYEDKDAAPRLALKFVGSNDSNEKWLFVADAETGEILFQEDQIIFDNVSGYVEGYSTENFASEQCEDEVLTPMLYCEVKSGDTYTYTDSEGFYTLEGLGTSEAIIESRIRGRYFTVTNLGGGDAFLSETVLPPATADFVHNPTNEEYPRAEVNAYVNANNVRDFVLKYNPSFPGVASRYEFPLFVNMTHDNCEYGGAAYYDNLHETINMCHSISIYPNGAFQSIVFHEYGHHLVKSVGSRQWVYGEGISDAVAMIYADESGIGYGFEGDCEQPYRDGDITLNYPCNIPPHYCGQVLSGSIWEFRNELLITHPETYRDTLANLVINSIPLHVGGYVTPAITLAFLILDDDDANLANGTPHYDQICTGFARHNMDCPDLAPVLFEYPGGRHDIVMEETETLVNANILSNSSEPISGTGLLYYSVDGGAYQAVSLTEISLNEYELTLPAVPCGSRIEWYLAIETLSSGTVYDPVTAPIQNYLSVSTTGSLVVFDDDFETDKGWTSMTEATTGTWMRGIPGPTDWGAPLEDFDGSGICYVTDSASGKYGVDVDYGSVSLFSPTIDISNCDALIHYARWFTNHGTYDYYGNSEPEDVDLMEVFVSNDNGGTWIPVETVGPIEQSAGGWYEHAFIVGDFVTPTDQVSIKFKVTDEDEACNVEGGVDDVTFTLFTCTDQLMILTNTIPDWNTDLYYEQQLTAVAGSGQVTWSDKYDDLISTGLTLSPTGLVSGTPLTAGPISFTAVAVDEGAGNVEKLFDLSINNPVSITTETFPEVEVDSVISLPLAATDGTAPLMWSDKNGDLAGTGLDLLSAGFLAGAPKDTGTFVFTVKVEDAAGGSDEKILSVRSIRIWMCGDANNDKSIDILDVVFLINYKYKYGFAPLPLYAGDVNSDGAVNILDIVYLLNFKYKEGPEPFCPGTQ